MADDTGRQRIVTGQERGRDREEQVNVRPQTLDEYDVGQREIIYQLRMRQGAAQQMGSQPPSR